MIHALLECCQGPPPENAVNADGTINFKRWREMVEEAKLPFMVYDPPQKKVEFTKCRCCNFFPPRATIGTVPPCNLAGCLQSRTGHTPETSFRISEKPEEWMKKMLVGQDHTHCPEFLKGVWWMRDNIANETIVTFQDIKWDTKLSPSGNIVGWKATRLNWSTGSNLWGTIASELKPRWARFEIENTEHPKWIGLSGDDFIYILGEEDKGKLVHPDGSPVDFVVGEDMMRISCCRGSPKEGIFYQYLVRRIATQDSAGNIVLGKNYEELLDRATRPTVPTCCCDLFTCNITDEQFPQLYDTLDDHQINFFPEDFKKLRYAGHDEP